MILTKRSALARLTVTAVRAGITCPIPNPQEGVTSLRIHGKIRRSPECLHRLPRCGQDLVWTEQDHGGKL